MIPLGTAQAPWYSKSDPHLMDKRVLPAYGAIIEKEAPTKLLSSSTPERLNGEDYACHPQRFNAFKLYMEWLSARPLATKAVTSALISGASDILTQRLSGTKLKNLSRRRAYALAGVGFMLTAPLFHYFYDALERVLPVDDGWRNTALQVARFSFISR